MEVLAEDLLRQQVMRTRHALLAVGLALLLGPVVLPLAAWFALLLLPAAAVLFPIGLIFGIAVSPTLVDSAPPVARPAATPRPPVSSAMAPAT